MKVALFFIILWNTNPMEVEKSNRGYFDTMERCEQVIDTMVLMSRSLGQPHLLKGNIQGKILVAFCEEEEQQT